MQYKAENWLALSPGKCVSKHRVLDIGRCIFKYFLRKCDQIGWKLRNWSHLMKKSLLENFIFCAVLKKAINWY